MKVELVKFSNDMLDQNRRLLVFGNFPELADMLCDSFVDYKKQQKCLVKQQTLSAAEFLKRQELIQTSLFETALMMYQITNVLDSNIANLLEKCEDTSNSVFIITPGDFRKSKKASDTVATNKQWLAIPAFKNPITYSTITRYFFKEIAPDVAKKVAGIIEQDSASLTKLLLLYESDPSAITEYSIETSNWLTEMQPISLLRFLSACQAKGSLEKVLEPILGSEKKLPNLSEYFLKTELEIKNGKNISSGTILGHLVSIDLKNHSENTLYSRINSQWTKI